MTTLPALSPPALPPAPQYFPGAFATINPTPAPATVPISFISDVGAQPSGIVPTSITVKISQSGPDVTVTLAQPVLGLPLGSSVVQSGVSLIALPLAPLPTPVGARVSMPPGTYPTEYQQAGSNVLQAAIIYNFALTVYNPALATFLASASWAAFVAAGETGPALTTLVQTGDYATWIAAYLIILNAYNNAYVPAYNSGQSALNWWQTYANAVNFWNNNPTQRNPYSSANRL